jgi:hypothetical protein
VPSPAEVLLVDLAALVRGLRDRSTAPTVTVARGVRSRLEGAVHTVDRVHDQADACHRLHAALDGVQQELARSVLGGITSDWQGQAAAIHVSALWATRELIAAGAAAMRQARDYLSEYMRALVAVRTGLTQPVRDLDRVAARIVAAPETVDRGNLIDAIRHAVAAVADLVKAESELRSGLGDVTAKARAQAIRPTAHAWDPVAAVTLAAAGAPILDDGVLSLAQLGRLAAFSPEQRAQVIALLANPGGSSPPSPAAPAEAAYLMKAFAAGHSVETVSAFARDIHGRSPSWMREQMNLVHATSGDFTSGRIRDVEYRGGEINQPNNITCNATTLVVARAQADPVYALWLTTDGHGPDLTERSGGQFVRAFNEEVRHVYGELRADGAPRDGAALRLYHDGGTTMQQMERWLEADARRPWFGTAYQLMAVEADSAQSLSLAWDRVVAAANQGLPAFVAVGDGVDGHATLGVAMENGVLAIFDPQDGTIVPLHGVSAADLGRTYGELLQVLVPQPIVAR